MLLIFHRFFGMHKVPFLKTPYGCLEVTCLCKKTYNNLGLTGQIPPTYSSAMWSLDMTTHNWTQHSYDGQLFRSGGTAVPSTDGRLFVMFGGSHGGNLNDIQKYDTMTSRWLTVNSTGVPPSARTGVLFVFFHTIFYLFCLAHGS